MEVKERGCGEVDARDRSEGMRTGTGEGKESPGERGDRGREVRGEATGVRGVEESKRGRLETGAEAEWRQASECGRRGDDETMSRCV